MEYLTLEQQNKQRQKKASLWLIAIALIGLSVWGVWQLAAHSSKPNGPANITVDSVSAGDNVLGRQDAPLTLIEYGDFQCPACAAYNPIVLKLAGDYPDQLRIVYRHFPLKSIHAYAIYGAYAAEAAGKQGKFWAMEELLFANRSQWAAPGFEQRFINYASQLNLDTEQFKKDYDSQEVKIKVETSYENALSLGLTGTPTFFLNGEQISPPADYNKFKEIIDEKLNQK